MDKGAGRIQFLHDFLVSMPPATEIKEMLAILRYIFRIAANYQVSRLPIQETHLTAQTLRKADIISVKPGYIVSVRCLQTGIECGRYAFITLSQQPDTRVG